MARSQILDPYTRRVDDTRHKVSRVLLVSGLLLFAMMLGFIVAILPMQLVFIPLTPILLLAALALWMAPDADPQLDGAIRNMMLVFLFIMMIYPDYIAFTIPGVGWVSFGRLTMGALFFTGMWAISTSSRVRHEIYDVITVVKPIYWVFLAFVVLQFVLAVVTFNMDSRWFRSQIFWYYMFIIAAWSFTRPGTSRLMYQMIIIACALQCFYGMAEWFMRKPFWTEFIPPFMRVEEELLANVLSPSFRTGGVDFRVKSIYFTPITFAEFLSLTLPFVLYAVIYARRFMWRVAAGALAIFMIVNGVLTDSRSATNGVIIGVMGTIALWALRRYWVMRNQRDMIAPAAIWAFPAAALLMGFAILFVPRVRGMTLGGKQHAGSNDVRSFQWDSAWRALERNPFGHGPNQGGEIAGTVMPNGFVTLDSYYISLLVDYGVVGFLLYMAFFILICLICVRIFILAENENEMMAGPIGISLGAFVVIKYVFTQTENHFLTFAFAGWAIAIAWMQARRLADVPKPVPTPMAPVVPRRVLEPAPAYGTAPAR